MADDAASAIGGWIPTIAGVVIGTSLIKQMAGLGKRKRKLKWQRRKR